MTAPLLFFSDGAFGAYARSQHDVSRAAAACILRRQAGINANDPDLSS